MSCSCGSKRIASVDSKHNDMFSLKVPHLNIEHNGYAPYFETATGSRPFGGDYTRFSFCLDCGQIQNFSIITDQMVRDELCEEGDF